MENSRTNQAEKEQSIGHVDELENKQRPAAAFWGKLPILTLAKLPSKFTMPSMEK